MLTIVSRLDITQIFCDVDDFCQQWENLWQQVPQLPSTTGEQRSKSRIDPSENSQANIYAGFVCVAPGFQRKGIMCVQLHIELVLGALVCMDFYQ
ncbi:MAG: hypothetical protein ACHBN1_31375 [Heteroscytonema crispum UTEX LB 1556]